MANKVSFQTSHPISLNAFCEYFWDLERRCNLLEFNANGVYVWQAYRMDIYYLLTQRLQILEQPQNISIVQPFHKKVQATISRIKYFKRDPVFVSKAPNTSNGICVIEHPRANEYKGLLTDIYTHDLVVALLKTQTDIVCLDSSLNGCHKKTETNYRYYLDLIETYAELSGSFAPIISAKTSSHLTKLERYVNDQFGTDLKLVYFFQKKIAKFKTLEKLYTRLFLRFKILKLYVVVSYQHAPAISAARKLSIDVFELQHGTFSKFHLGYSFPNMNSNLRYFPDTFLAWNDFWKKCFDDLKTPAITIAHGFPFLYEKLENYSMMPKDPTKIVVLSQGAIGRRLAVSILGAIDDLEDFEIYYKLHPGEYDRWHEYPELVRLSKYPNVKIVYSCDLYQLLGTARYMIGVFSTAIYEGIEIGVQPILVDLPGIEYMEDLLNSGKAIRFTDFTKNSDRYNS
jgi:hypothetical protein